ncbi:hypothetical protein [Streptomyces aureoverticillatus]|uniref:hypothetical protein n=1 Tax=Streptomyces aureoverticillatus TaxID=66871 RepID=UPI0013DBAF5A|nr:hypothetical protein [Streptomyces aureoverticillatus]QIB49465.1 hypothetical protein G3H79_40815 [Streptomyces aureoverticillatus]
MTDTAPQPQADSFSALIDCFSTDLAALLGEEPPGDITPTGFIDLVERAMHFFGTARVDPLQRADEELDYAVGHLTDALTINGGDQRDRLARARTHLRYAIETTR